MQVRKVAVVATGALATAAAMGSTPAFAADSGGVPEVAPAVLGVLDYEAKHRASDEAMRQLAEQWLTVTPEQTWSAPWAQEPPQILSIGNNAAVSALATQFCGTTAVLGLGTALPVASPNTVLGDCNNANIAIEDDGDDALFSILDNSALSIAPIQVCGSTGVAGAGLVAPIASPNTVWGDCNNGNIVIAEDERDRRHDKKDNKKHDRKHDRKHDKRKPGGDGYRYHESNVTEAGNAEAGNAEAATARSENFGLEFPWEVEPPQILAAGNGSAVSAAPVQLCGSTVVVGAGTAAPIASPNTVFGDCNNGNIKIHGDDGDALFSLLNNSAVSTAPIQTCGTSGVAGIGIAAPIASPNTVIGDCNNGNILIRG
jgi:hypothetical protein